jgi:hypothetical protein
MERLLKEPGVNLCAVVVGQYRKHLRPFKNSSSSSWKVFDRIRSIILEFALKIWHTPQKLLNCWHDTFIKPLVEYQLDSFCRRHRLAILKANDINIDTVAKQITSLAPELGIILGRKDSENRLYMIPRLGSLTINRCDIFKYDDSDKVGFWERKNNEASLEISIERITFQASTREILADLRISIEKYDNDESLRIKVDAFGVNLYYRTILDFLGGELRPRNKYSQAKQGSHITSSWSCYLFWNSIKKSHRKALRRRDVSPWSRLAQRWFAAIRISAYYLSLPALASIHERLRRRASSPIVIFYYHGVGNGAENWMTLPIEIFWHHSSYAKKYFDVISLEEAIRRMRSGCNCSPSVVFTFDDGYESCYHNLLPIIAAFSIPATFFVCAESAKQGLRLEHDLSKGYRDAKLMTYQQLGECATGGVEIAKPRRAHTALFLSTRGAK